ncbi:hypothetical protein HDU90_005350 [Geranomyces variabilis]|nr:hypothetical protein HDU90_005350 [Geranomyces variabilis]
MSQYSSMKPGDWMCTACDCHNFQSRTACFRCNTPRDAMAGGGAPPQQSYGQGGGGGGGYPATRPGDWVCPKPGCSFANFASRHECMRCGTPSPLAQDTHGGSGGGSAYGGGGGGGYGGGYGGGQQHSYRPAAEMRPGDWNCAHCSFHNFQSRGECFKCHAPRTDGQVPGPNSMGTYGGARMAPSLKPGDWMCNSCNSHNFRSRVECFRCRAPMPMGGEQGGGHSMGQPPAPGVSGGDHGQGQYGQSLYSQENAFGIGGGTYPPGTEHYNPEWRG